MRVLALQSFVKRNRVVVKFSTKKSRSNPIKK